MPEAAAAPFSKLLKNLDILRMILEQMNLPAINCMGRTCQIVRPVAFLVSSTRFFSIIKQFFPTQLSSFSTALTKSHGIITGSCALDMLLGLEGDEPSDLNIIVPLAGLSKIQNFLRSAHFTEHAHSNVHRTMASCTNQFHLYTHDTKMVTISQTKSSDVLDAVINSPSTADMTFMTAGGQKVFSSATGTYVILCKNMCGIHKQSGD
ncbi:hypothetical protein BV22DRAFT_1052214 [Leucogyrophana mollusca]|uniref:Uncharacterized protein n=1 Tax=Leucogyrophana mollusca TaxID=85980 RepID=A0ACB8AWJ4_9AGAM|nr:hypothetical protein BV22DRAFT_1052214 [Leucogyrophana mollusca]